MMKSFLEQNLHAFLKENFIVKRGPLLLGLSGGADSLALFHALILQRRYYPFSLHLAHIDHGWRQESADEAAILEKQARENGIPFHLKHLQIKEKNGNLEELWRGERYSFFKKIYEKEGCQALLLGHHGDDQAETVLKRVFEGAALTNLYGIKEVTSYDGMVVWRPLIRVRKNEIYKWLQHCKLKPFEDHSNKDVRFLRARMRQELIPNLSKAFGKDITGPLGQLAEDAIEMQAYFDERVGKYLQALVRGPLGLYLDFSQFPMLNPVEMKFLVRRLLLQEGCCPSRDSIKKMVIAIEKSLANRYFSFEEKDAFVDRGFLFIVKKKRWKMPPLKRLIDGEQDFGSWIIKVHMETQQNPHKSSWKDVWKGYGVVSLPKDTYYASVPKNNAAYPRTNSLDTWWGKHKVPAFLRQGIPIIENEQGIQHEFLTGKVKDLKKENVICISIQSAIVT